MNQFETFSTIGFQHILDIKAFDHLLFVIVLCASASFKHWRLLLGLITAFTIGHCLSLVGTAFIDTTSIQELIEICIPLTIIVSIILALKNPEQKNFAFQYMLVLIFGLIHGMGFASYLKSLLFQKEGLLANLFYFNIGIEVGQLLIVISSILLVNFILVFVPHKDRIINKTILFLALLLSLGLLMNLLV